MFDDYAEGRLLDYPSSAMNAEQSIRAEIDNYSDSIFAIVGFMNFYRFDDTTRKIRNDVLVFQGRRLTPSKQTNAEGGTVEYVLRTWASCCQPTRASWPK